MRRSKIVCTLGPAVDSYEQLKSLIEAGMNVARLNMSHGSHAEHEERYHRVRQAAARTTLDWRSDQAAPAGPSPQVVVAALNRDGICTGLQLSPETVAEILAFAEANPCYGGRNWRTRFDAAD